MRKVSKKQAKINRELASIKKTLDPICFICGIWGNGDLAHLLPKSTYPQHETNPQNLVILCRNCHNLYDNDMQFRKQQTHIHEKICTFDKRSADKYFATH